MFQDQHYLYFLYFQVSLFYQQYVALWKKRTQIQWTKKTVSPRGKQKQKAFKLAFSELVKLRILSIRKTKQNNSPKKQESQNNLISGGYWRKCIWGTQLSPGIYFIWKRSSIWSQFLKSTSAAGSSLSHLLLYGQKRSLIIQQNPYPLICNRQVANLIYSSLITGTFLQTFYSSWTSNCFGQVTKLSLTFQTMGRKGEQI